MGWTALLTTWAYALWTHPAGRTPNGLFLLALAGTGAGLLLEKRTPSEGDGTDAATDQEAEEE